MDIAMRAGEASAAVVGVSSVYLTVCFPRTGVYQPRSRRMNVILQWEPKRHDETGMESSSGLIVAGGAAMTRA